MYSTVGSILNDLHVKHVDCDLKSVASMVLSHTIPSHYLGDVIQSL